MAEIEVGRSILEANDKLAGQHRERFAASGVKVLNLISSPGAGKTSVLEQTLKRLQGRLNCAVIEGDIQTDEDARRVAACGVPAVQIQTQGACHLDGVMINEALAALDLASLDLLIIENVGNLVCPVDFDLGEDMKVAVLSVTEGDDKPSKYPALFQQAGVLLVNKVDLLPYIDCDMERIHRTCHQLNPEQKVFDLSCRTGEGLDPWVDWLTGWAKG
ncbi:MAG: hydrogenase nickel incorporation protein HypB [Desulfarculaceae bacterium]|nr:hydrogenase nickel incorporation protein HypB [Desulfarculaceae bacterium]MCF8073112.1 hydrogenase nickel incorporation protein HypB [Desulfarculaceae bacterium]MCF8101803.1 hydrogenase nickel incorporation protein HypB [Desulfarculaceae bacterium]MCF8117367.1 hydrogenase nickel incorporation protein HypB [Desulfarculaceae bacterium]